MVLYLVTGGAGGIGSALARRLAARGDSVHLVGRDAAKLEPLASELSGTFALADVLDRAALEQAVLAAGPDIAGLAYCAGSITLKPVSRITDDDVERDFKLNALGALRAVQAALPWVRAHDHRVCHGIRGVSVTVTTARGAQTCTAMRPSWLSAGWGCPAGVWSSVARGWHRVRK